MTTKTDKDAAGKVLYAEFKKGAYTFQLITTPFATSSAGEVIMPNKISRRISVYHPRRNWQFERAYVSAERIPTRDAYGNFEKMSKEDAAKVAEYAWSRFYGSQFENLLGQGWDIVSKPIAVELTYAELVSILGNKMPVALYRRIERVRKAQGFPEELVSASAE